MGAPFTGGPGFLRSLTLKQVKQYYKMVERDLAKQLKAMKGGKKGSAKSNKGRSL